MSHHSTPQIHSKRTPGSTGFETPNLVPGQHPALNPGQGHNQGLNQGHNQGHNQGNNQGLNQGLNEGPNSGHNSGPQYHSSVNSASPDLHAQRQQQGPLNSGHVVSDKGVRSAKQLLHAYIYEFLVKSTLPETARRFIAEADVPSVPANGRNSAKTSPVLLHKQENEGGFKEAGSSVSASTTPQTPAMSAAQFSEEHNLPGLHLSLEAPQGFLCEWWQVFWDVFQAKNGRGHPSAIAEQYLQMHAMKHNHPSEPFPGAGAASAQMMQNGMLGAGQGPVSMNGLGLGGPPPNGAHPNTQNMMPQQPGPAPPITLQQQQQIQRQLQGQNPPANVDPRQQRYMMQMMMKQQQFQQQQFQQQKQQQMQGMNQLPHQHPGPPNQPLGPPPHGPHPSQLPSHQPQHQPLQPPQPPHMPMQQQQQTPHQTPQQIPLPTPPVNQLPRQGQHPGMEQYPNNSIPMNMKQQPHPQHQQQQHMYMQQQQLQHQQQQQHQLHQQQLQQPPQGLSQAQNRIQQQAQTQMNNLRQQAVVAQQHQGPMGPGPGPGQGPNPPAAENPHQNGDRSSPGNVNGAMNGKRGVPPQPLQIPPQNMGGMQVPYPGAIPNGAPGMSPSYITGNMPVNTLQMQMNANMAAHGIPPGRNSNALQDYQNQLMVLERQNKKRLDIARSTGTTESPVAMPQMHPHQPMQVQPSPSPHSVSQASPPAAPTNSKPKKESAAKAPAKRGNKQAGASSAMSPQSAGTDANGVANGRSGQTKRDRTGPPTPSGDSEGAKKKKRSNGSDSPKRPAKATATGKKEKSTPQTKNAPEPKASAVDDQHDDTNGGKMPLPAGAYFQPSLASIEMLGSGAGSSGDANYFNTGSASNIDDIDFDFNSFLDGGDDNLNDGLSGFNWTNPIEND